MLETSAARVKVYAVNDPASTIDQITSILDRYDSILGVYMLT